MTTEMMTISTSQSSWNILMEISVFAEFLPGINTGHCYPMLLLKWVRWAGKYYSMSCMLYLIKSVCYCVRHEVLLPLGIPEILDSSRLQTKGSHGGVSVFSGVASCQVYIY